MTEMSSKLILITPEILLFIGAVVVAVLGLSSHRRVRHAVPWTTVGFLVAAIVATNVVYDGSETVTQADLLFPNLGLYLKMMVGVIAIGLVLLGIGMVDRRYEEAVRDGRAGFDPLRVVRGEYHAFLLLSIAGTMLIANANDLIWLFLAIELSSLPTYVMVALGRGTRRNKEAAIKYFFLGAMSSATFLYGFALLYGASGTLSLTGMQEVFATQAAGDGIPLFGLIGMVLAFVGLCFKITAVPMHFYAPDVYQGAPTPVTGFISFMPKVAGFTAIIMLCAALGWSGHHIIDNAGVKVPTEGLPRPVHATLWVIAALTMILGNIGALLQTSIKRLLAYSSISHSGYMLVGVIAGTAEGIDAVFFYLVTYGVATVAVFGVLCGLQRHGREVETLDDLSGLWKRHPGMAFVLALSAFSMLGLPPLIGFWGKLDLVVAGISAGETPLVVIMMAASAVSSYYYLHLAGLPVIRKPDARTEGIEVGPSRWPRVAGMVFGIGILVVPIGARELMEKAEASTKNSWLEPAETAMEIEEIRPEEQTPEIPRA
ncbi:MAG: NADH-quinone oxidoreductase subunit N [Phycisphaerales bacterium]|jgi:NADH-quinone oxidoreductase subunit N|nr:NADH-quinone oxidoreductase subunit N [Phycisphaerales bacterium]